jgi:MFS family permease
MGGCVEVLSLIGCGENCHGHWSGGESTPCVIMRSGLVLTQNQPCESLPSATIAEIFFLHERAYRIGIYTLLLLGGKNLIPLVSAAIIQAMGWRWVFWIVSMVVGFNLFLLFFFVPETFWDRAPRPKPHSARPSLIHRAASSFSKATGLSKETKKRPEAPTQAIVEKDPGHLSPASAEVETRNPDGGRHATFAEPLNEKDDHDGGILEEVPTAREVYQMDHPKTSRESLDHYIRSEALKPVARVPTQHELEHADAEDHKMVPHTFKSTLKLYKGRQQKVGWWKAAFRPFVLFAYPAVLWSTVVYSFSIGWLIVLSESVAHIYQAKPYNFSALGTGLVYLSPFIGGVIGTAVAGKVSDIIVRFMSRRNGGIYEPEFRLIMAIPVAICTAIGLMGFGWSAQQHDSWIVPTVFFGIISFGCSLGSTTAITFCVDSYRQYAGEALVTLNFSKSLSSFSILLLLDG